MPDKLPKGWAKTKLGEVCSRVATIQPGDTPDTEFTYFDIGGIDNETNRVVETKTVTGRNAPSRARQSVQKDDILFSTVRTYLKKIARIERDYPNPIASTGFVAIRAAEGVSPQFLFSQVLSEDFLQPLHALQTGSSYPAVRGRDVFGQPILLAPSAEQKRLVEKLAAILSRVGAGEAAAARALARLKRYRASVLQAAVTGELTRVWRKAHPKPEETGPALLRRLLAARRARWEADELARLTKAGKKPKDAKWKARYPEPVEPETTDLPPLPRGWTWASVEQLNPGDRPCAYGVLKPGADVSDGVPLVRVGDINAGRISVAEMKHVQPRIAAQYRRTKLQGGEVLITLVGAIGRTAVVPGALAGANTARAVGVIPLSAIIDPAWVELWFRSPAKLNEMVGKAHEVARKTLNLEDVRLASVALPPLDEVSGIVREVEHRLTHADRLTAALETALARARLWRQSVLQAAFGGKLVPQSDDDEPASVLLKKIRAARAALAAQPKPKRGHGGRKKKMKTARRPILDVLQEHSAPMKPEDVFAAAGFDEASVDAFFAELKELNAGKKIREKRDPHDRGLVLLEVRP